MSDAPEALAWKGRFIITQDGGVDLPPDRQHCEGPESERPAFLAALNAAMPSKELFATIKAKLIAREIKTREAGEVVLFEGHGIRCVGNSNASAGYLYVTATPVEEEEIDINRIWASALTDVVLADHLRSLADKVRRFRPEQRTAILREAARRIEGGHS